jgi:hypothetical protein
MQPFGYERQTPYLILTDNIHSDTQAEPLKLSPLTLYIDLWEEGKPAPGKNPPGISPPLVIFRIGVGTEIRTQNRTLWYPTKSSLDRAPNQLVRTRTGHWLSAPYLNRVRKNATRIYLIYASGVCSSGCLGRMSCFDGPTRIRSMQGPQSGTAQEKMVEKANGQNL